MIGNCLGIGFLVVGCAHGITIVILAQQRLTQVVADADHVAHGAFKLELAFHECRAESIQAGVDKLADHLRILDHNRDTGRRPQVELVAVPEPQA